MKRVGKGFRSAVDLQWLMMMMMMMLMSILFKLHLSVGVKSYVVFINCTKGKFQNVRENIVILISTDSMKNLVRKKKLLYKCVLFKDFVKSS